MCSIDKSRTTYQCTSLIQYSTACFLTCLIANSDIYAQQVRKCNLFQREAHLNSIICVLQDELHMQGETLVQSNGVSIL